MKLKFFFTFPIFIVYVLSDLTEPCDARFDGCLARNKALPSDLFVSLTEPDTNFQASEPCPQICHSKVGARFQINRRFENPQIHLAGYILHGSVEADILAAPGKGIILSFYLQSDDRDEIDVAEIFGGNHLLFQTNYFSKGDVSTNGKGIYVGLESSPLYNYHRYGLNWTTKEIMWTVDGSVVRHVKREDTDDFPVSPMKIKFSLWVGGDTENEPGTVTWAGGRTDFSEAPFQMYVRNIRVLNLGGGSEYVYGNDHPLAVLSEPGRFANGLLAFEATLSASSPFFVVFPFFFVAVLTAFICWPVIT